MSPEWRTISLNVRRFQLERRFIDKLDGVVLENPNGNDITVGVLVCLSCLPQAGRGSNRVRVKCDTVRTARRLPKLIGIASEKLQRKYIIASSPNDPSGERVQKGY